MARLTKAQAESQARVLGLVQHSYVDGWSPFDLAWDTKVEWNALDFPDSVSLAATLPEFRKLPARERARFKRLETASHLSGLAFGERRATLLAGQTAELSPEEDPTQAWFLGTLMADEGKHHAALVRYLEEKLDARFPPHPSLPKIFDDLLGERDYVLNIYVGQVLLEGAAASLLAALLIAVHEPLLRSLLKRIAIDEARHMKFADVISRDEVLTGVRRRRMEDYFFEGAVAGVSSMLATGAWRACGLPARAARDAATDELKRRGVLDFYGRVVVRQLAQRGFTSERLRRLLETGLENRLRNGP